MRAIVTIALALMISVGACCLHDIMRAKIASTAVVKDAAGTVQMRALQLESAVMQIWQG